ncbi:MAG TPA: beta-propeller fold lactonase family protein, partial [Armatimonadota bacterium]|nr:beta-propeller fold lactonase family protein [Armatimonadota bacterium]
MRMDAQVSQAPLVYIGTYTANSGSEGIYVYRFDRATGELTFTGHTGKVANPSYLAIHPDGRHLYSVCEVGTFEGKKGGGVSAFRIDRRTGELTLLNQEPSSGGAPCYISLGKRGRHALVANYSAGSVGVLPIREDGTVAPLSHVVQHE